MGRKLSEATNACRSRFTRGETTRRFFAPVERAFAAPEAGFFAAGLRAEPGFAPDFVGAAPSWLVSDGAGFADGVLG
jgi:hypothetical protein